MLEAVSRDPERAFEDLRTMLFDAASALVRCAGHADAAAALDGFSGNRFGQLLHHYELSNWILYARAYAQPARPRPTRWSPRWTPPSGRRPSRWTGWPTHWIDADRPAALRPLCQGRTSN